MCLNYLENTPIGNALLSFLVGKTNTKNFITYLENSLHELTKVEMMEMIYILIDNLDAQMDELKKCERYIDINLS